jgi:transposase
MGHIPGTSREQLWLEAQCIDDFVDKDNIVRVIDLFIETQDLEAMGFVKAVAKGIGRPPYNPKHLTKLYVYGYLNRIRSSRRLEAEVGRNIEVMWLLEGLRPDDKTISNFRTDNRIALKNLFKSFNRFCQGIEMLGNETCSIDGSKFKANNGRKNYHSLKDAQERLSKLNAAIERYLTELDRNDADEAADRDAKGEGIHRILEKLSVHKAKAEIILAAINENNGEGVCSVDPEARLMKQARNRGYEPSFNVQTAIDAKHGLIIDFDVTDSKNDKNQLENMAFKAREGMTARDGMTAKEGMDSKTINLLADTGYVNGKQIHTCEESAIRCHIPMPEPNKQPEDGRFHRDRFIYNEEADAYTCPMGNTLPFRRTRRKGNYRVYHNRAACLTCEVRQHCTKGTYRSVDRHPYIADIERADARAKENRTLYARRKELSEPPFGTVKEVWGYRQFLCRGKEKAIGESALMFLAYNLRRVVNIKGVETLLKVLNKALNNLFSTPACGAA